MLCLIINLISATGVVPQSLFKNLKNFGLQEHIGV
jgi:hypothetical protein